MSTKCDCRYYRHEDMQSARYKLTWLVACFFVSLLGLSFSVLWYHSIHGVFAHPEKVPILCYLLGFASFVGGCYVIMSILDYNHESMGLHFTTHVRSAWRSASKRLGLVGRHEGKLYAAGLAYINGSCMDWTARVLLWPDQTIDQLRAKTDDLAKILGAASLEFDYAEGGHIIAKCSRYVVPPPVIVEEVVVAPVRPPRLTGVKALSAVEVGTMHNGVAYLPVLYSHLLLVGITGAGKSAWVWSIIFGLRDGIQEGIVELWGVDPKGLELAIGSMWWDRYESEELAMVELLEAAVVEIKRRGALMAGKARKVVPSQEMPLIVVFVDELADIMAIPDKKLRERAANAITRILRQGRALAVGLVGASQTPNKETLSMRDDFPVRICLAVASSQVDMVLGQGAKEAGARPDRFDVRPIPEGSTKTNDAGSAYVWNVATDSYVVMRAKWIDDQMIIRTGQVLRMGQKQQESTVTTEELSGLVYSPTPVYE